MTVLSRRNALKSLTAASAMLMLSSSRSIRATPQHPWLPPPYSVPMTIPPVLAPARRTSDSDFYEIEIAETSQEILPGIQTKVLTYAGCFPGPTIQAEQGRKTVVAQINKMYTDAAVHLHGANVPASSDGYPMDVIKPNKTRVYNYPNAQPAGTLWYHDHAHHLEAEQVYRGLAGAYLLSDSVEQQIPLPRGEFDVPLLIRDAKFDHNGQLVWVFDDFLDRPTMLVNGRPQPYFTVKPSLYRLRLFNVSNIEPFRFRLDNGALFLQIGSDGGLLPSPALLQEIELFPSERADVLVDFRSTAPGTSVALENIATSPAAAQKRQVMQFRVAGVDSARRLDLDAVRGWQDGRVPQEYAPAEGWPVAAPPLPPATQQRRFVLHFDVKQEKFLINGREFDANRVDATVKLGSTEIWEIVNADGALGIAHAMHLHLVQFRVLDRNGKPEPAHDAYPKDTVRLHPGDTVHISVTFNSFVGRYPFHCHFIDHASHSMMGQFEVVP
ncbi:multicopper oxidase family protein [Lentzea alba]|uniref:multicopper oxidase family protein n=1 Tax=Lentzea alba TaxID=2714351 RepID=UPI0039BF5AE1